MAIILLAGATGLVGSEVLKLALADPRVSRVIAPTRRALAPHPHFENPVTEMKHLTGGESWWRADAVICALGTTIRKAGSQAAFREVDHELPLLIAKFCREQGARSYSLTSSIGAKAGSSNFYLRTKGETERDLEAIGYPSLTILRPSVIGGLRSESRPMERLSVSLLEGLRPLVPRRLRVIHASRIAARLLESALAAAPGRTIYESEEI